MSDIEQAAKRLKLDCEGAVRVRELLRAECDECPTCGAGEADTPTDAQLVAWLRGGPCYTGIQPAWHAHMDTAWRA